MIILLEPVLAYTVPVPVTGLVLAQTYNANDTTALLM